MDPTAAAIGWRTDAWCLDCGDVVALDAVVIRARAPAHLTRSMPADVSAAHALPGRWCGPVELTIHAPEAWCTTCLMIVDGPMQLAADGFRLQHGSMPHGCDVVVHGDHGVAVERLSGRHLRVATTVSVP